MTKTLTGVRFKTQEDAEAYLRGDQSKAIKRGQPGYRRAPFEEAIIHEKLHEGVLRMLDNVPAGAVSEKGCTYTTRSRCAQCEGRGILLYAEQANECVFCRGAGIQ